MAAGKKHLLIKLHNPFMKVKDEKKQTSNLFGRKYDMKQMAKNL